MHWLYSEYILKGVFLGLLLFTALQGPDWQKTGYVAAYMGGGLAGGLLVSLFLWIFRGIRISGRILSLLVFLVLESPTLVYLGLIGGLAYGAWTIRDPDKWGQSLLPICAGCGALLGVMIAELRRIRSTPWRFGLALSVAVILVGGALYYLEQYPEIRVDRQMFGSHILLGLPFFYLLVVAGAADESEGEIAAICSAMAIGVWLIRPTPSLPGIGLLIPAALFILYTRNIMPKLKVFKHTLRGYSNYQAGRIRPALKELRQALQLDPTNQVALDGFAKVHSGIDAKKIADDPQTCALLDLDLCLNRAGKLLWQPNVSAGHLQEVTHLLDLVASQKPLRTPEVDYWRSIADMRAHKPDAAAERLARVLDPAQWPAESQPWRSAVLLPAWQMALLRSKDLAARAGLVQLALPGRRMEAIAATERLLATNPKDSDAWELKRALYEGLTEQDYYERTPGEGEFDGSFARELGLARIGDPARWRRGVEYLRVAAYAVPAHAPSLFTQIAQTFEQADDRNNARRAHDQLKEAGLAFGPNNYAADEKAIFYGVIKRMADDAGAAGDADGAINLLTLYSEYERAGLETLRQLAEMHERRGDALAALRYNDKAMVYNPNDRDLFARKDRYYYSVFPQQVRELPEEVRAGLDAEYCLNKARQVLGNRNSDMDAIEWALHLADMACVLRPKSLEAQLLAARARLWKGDRDEALRRLEDLREVKPEKLSGSDEDAWYRTHQVLGDLYLNEYARPDLAVPCYMEFRKSTKSGADTLYKLGQAYENLGDAVRAGQFYEQVTAFTEHPRYYDAQESLRRVKGG